MVSRKRPNAVPILSYHQVTPRPHPAFRKYSVTPRQFATHMHWLRARGYEPVDLTSVAGWLRGSAELPRRPVVVTFDDGFLDAVIHAPPVLQACGFTAIFFVVAGLIGKQSAWLRAERGFESPMVDWERLKKLRDDGFAIGSHAVSHPRLSALPEGECRAELSDARRIIEQHVGTAVEHLAYPFGNWDERVRSIADDAGYTTACTTDIALATPVDHALSLPRVPVIGTEPLSLFAWRLRLAYAPREVARGVLARVTRLLGQSSGSASA
jgi:peptidoglycan/xylan/chitin deacetylase (PgdA/CDA1 family)